MYEPEIGGDYADYESGDRTRSIRRSEEEAASRPERSRGATTSSYYMTQLRARTLPDCCGRRVASRRAAWRSGQDQQSGVALESWIIVSGCAVGSAVLIRGRHSGKGELERQKLKMSLKIGGVGRILVQCNLCK
jgi:hypothetical protein